MFWFIIIQMFSLWSPTPDNQIWCYTRSGVPSMVYLIDEDIAHKRGTYNQMMKNNCIISEWPQQGGF